MPLNTRLYPLEAPGVRHFVRHFVSGKGGNIGKPVDLRSITRGQWWGVKVMLYH